ncbi:unnamed protein product [Lymnaea stagnalis]|uniref:Protein transport protein sec16 n=1 Tax=Lymnaea stagnalis TaxID=6523 RepID=A0AAV2HY74_LYMST
MSNSWNTNQYQGGLPNQIGPVKLFDPTQFQTPVSSFAGTPTTQSQDSKSDRGLYQSSAPVSNSVQHSAPAQAAKSSWNTWSNWGWTADNSQTQQDAAVPQQPSAPQDAIDVNSQYYNSGLYGNNWNQGWSGAGQYSETQAYEQPASVNSQEQPYREVYDQFHQPAQTPQQQYHGEGSFYGQSQQQQEQLAPPEEHQLHPEQQQASQGTDQGQDYQQAQGYYQQYQDQTYYNQALYNPNPWNTPDGQWGDGFQPHIADPLVNTEADNGSEKKQFVHSENSPEESLQQATGGQKAVTHLEAATLGQYDNDDDGTVSGFFGRDEDGDVSMDLARQGRGQTHQENEYYASPSFNKVPSTLSYDFQRSGSELTSQNYVSQNLPAKIEDDGREALQNVQELVHRMEKVDLSINPVDAQCIFGQVADDGLVTGTNQGEQVQQQRGNYSGYQNLEFDHSTALPPPSLPLDTSLRPSSPDGDHPESAESGGSGVSAGSSGLADWEIVPSQYGPKTHSRNSSPDNSVSFLSDRPDGGDIDKVNASQGTLPQPFTSGQSTTNENTHTHFPNLDPSKHSFPQDSAISRQTPTISQNDLGHRERRSGSPFIGAVIDSRQEVLPPVSQVAPPLLNISVPPPLLTQVPAGAANRSLLAKEGAKSPRFSEQPAITTAVQGSRPPMTTAIQGSRPPVTTAIQGTTTMTMSSPFLTPQVQSNIHSEKSAINSSTEGLDNSNTYSKTTKALTGQSNEDGNRVSRRDSDQTISWSDPNALSKQVGISTRKNSKDTEELGSEVTLTGEHRRHHSAFHPVSRPRQTTMSPATTLWDNTETPMANILLAPAVPLIIPGLSTSSTFTASTAAGAKTASKAEKVKTRGHNEINELSPNLPKDGDKMRDRGGRDGRSRDEKNRSFDSLDEIDAVIDDQRDRSFRSQKDPRDQRYPRDTDPAAGRLDRPLSRSGQYQYDRPLSRTEGYGKDESYRRYRTSYRDYGDSSFDERYDRPRSRQDETRNSRPTSRTGQDVDRSRTDYDRDRDYYYRDKSKNYGYDSFGRHADYYNDEKERWYRYYKDKEARYQRGYYEEYYGSKNAEYYQQQQQQQHQQTAQERRSTSRQEVDHLSNPSHSRGNTPGISQAPGAPPAAVPLPGPEYYGRNSRPSSRAEYNRDYYRNHAYVGYDPAYYDPGYGYDPYRYPYGYEYQGYDDAFHQGYDQGRLTPPKFSYQHVKACFGPNGQLVKVQPNRPTDGQPAIVEIQDVQSIFESCPETEELKLFPGPLTRNNTHKKDVLLFCQQKARSCAEDISLADRESAQLLWRLLELLIKQNGSVVGTDLSDLLLEGHEPSTHQYSLQGMKISPSLEALDENNVNDRDSPAVRVTSDRTVIMTADKEREGWIDRFRHLLLYGRKKDALECAMKNNLWGHALFLASKMDNRTHANVMTRFANSAMRMNDPLQTLYQLMSGRQPAAVTSIADERWGDWRPHLAMILSNQTPRYEVDRKSITTLGDTLATKGYLHASHFCYLMAQVNFGTYHKKTSKIVLIGSSHNLGMEEFASNDAIHCTEVYEYAQTLGNAAFCLPHFQVYKYLYACRLVDYGMTQEALHYLEVIASNIQQAPTWFQPPFVRLVYQLSNRLKYSDPQRLQSSEDAEDPVWIQQLTRICTAYDDGSLQPVSGTATPAGFPGTSTSSESGDCNTQNYSYVGDPNNTTANVGGGDMYGVQQSYQQPQLSNTGYYSAQDVAVISGQDLSYTTPSTEQQQVQQPDGVYQQPQYDYSQQQYDYTQGFHYAQHRDDQKLTGSSGEISQVAPGEITHGTSGGITQVTSGAITSGPVDTQPQHAQPQFMQPQYAQSHSQQVYTHQGYQPTPRASISTNEATEDDEEDDDEEEEEEVVDGPVSGFDYFENIGQQKVVAPPHRYRTLSSSSAGSTRRRRTTSGSSTGSVKAAPYKSSSSSSQHQQSGLGGNKKSGQQGANGSGWFGGLWSKFGRKGKNEMILPDDKNPAIVWDPVKKKWINADGTEEEESTAPPPPKDMDLLTQPPPAAPNAMGPPPPSGALGGNRFSLKAKAGTKIQYVDVNKPKPLTVPQNLFQVMPGTTPAPAQVFLPGTASATTKDANNSNLLGVPANTDQSSGEPTTSGQPTTTSGQPSMPVLFNPSSLQAGSTGQPLSAAGPGLKYGQRRAYPK